jgi:hypothetical protein
VATAHGLRNVHKRMRTACGCLSTAVSVCTRTSYACGVSLQLVDQCLRSGIPRVLFAQ